MRFRQEQPGNGCTQFRTDCESIAISLSRMRLLIITNPSIWFSGMDGSDGILEINEERVLGIVLERKSARPILACGALPVALSRLVTGHHGQGRV